MPKYSKSIPLILALGVVTVALVGCRPSIDSIVARNLGAPSHTKGTKFVVRAKPGCLVDLRGNELSGAEKARRMDEVASILRSRLAGIQGSAASVVEKQGDDRLVVEISGAKNPTVVIKELIADADLKFYPMDRVQSDGNPNGRWIRQDTATDHKTGQEIFAFQDTKTKKLIKGDTSEGRQAILKEVVNAYDPKLNPKGVRPVLSGRDLMPTAKGDINQNELGYVIAIEFNPEGSRKFGAYTKKHTGDILAVFLGDRIVTAPRIQVPITDGKAVITGFDSLEEAQRRADFLNAGALPVPLEVVEPE